MNWKFLRLLFIVAFSTVTWFLPAQERSKQKYYEIELKDGSRFSGYVIKDETDEIVIVTKSNDTIYIDTKKIETINLGDSSESTGENPGQKTKPSKEQSAYAKLHNILSLNLVDLGLQNLTMSYERIFARGVLGLKVPLSLGFGAAGSRYQVPRNKVWSGGADLNVYPMGQSKVALMIGLGYERGQYLYAVPQNILIRASKPEDLTISYNAWFTNVGMMVRLTDNVVMTIATSVGFRNDMNEDFYNYDVPDDSYFAYRLQFGFGARF